MMNQQDVFKKIGQILHELRDQYQYLEENPAQWNGFELDLFQANASFLAEHVQVFQKMNKLKAQSSSPAGQEEDGTLEVRSTVEIQPVIPVLEKEIFKPDNEPSKFEFILNDKPSSDLFDFEEKAVGEIFDRPLSPEEEQIIAQKQKLREKDSLLILPVVDEDDEIGPEPFLVSTPEANGEGLSSEALEEAQVAEELRGSATPIMPAMPASVLPEAVAQYTEPYEGQREASAEAVEESKADDGLVADRQKISTPLSYQEPAANYSAGQDERSSDAKSAPASDAPKMTLNDLLSGQQHKVATEHSRPVISDLKQAISFNDKMRYIKDLFNGYNLAYAEAIDLLNKMPDLESAHQFLERNYAVKNHWVEKQETADQFYELLQQRFK